MNTFWIENVKTWLFYQLKSALTPNHNHNPKAAKKECLMLAGGDTID